MNVDNTFYGCFWFIISLIILFPIYIISWAALKKLSPCCHSIYDPIKKCSICHGFGFIWPWKHHQ